MADWLRWGSPDPSESNSKSLSQSKLNSQSNVESSEFEATGFKLWDGDEANGDQTYDSLKHDCLKHDWLELDPRFEQLSAYLDGELSAPEARLVETWLTQDPDLRQLYVQLSGIQAGFDRLPLPAKADTRQLVAQVLAQVASSPESRPAVQSCWWRRKICSAWPQIPQMRIPTVAAALALLSGAVWAVWPQPQPIISLEDPPVEIAQIPETTLLAERYLLQPEALQDPYAILFAPETN